VLTLAGLNSDLSSEAGHHPSTQKRWRRSLRLIHGLGT
jgi:hypothetical protein